jgi:Zn ribbon nucleic-acid-binding protein
MSAWRGEADCPKCGSEGTLLVSGETSTVEIDGCWVCGYGCDNTERQVEFVPLKKLRVVEERKAREGKR